MRIDAHVTLWNAASPALRAHPHFPGDDRAYLPQHLLPILRRNRFDKALLVAVEGSEEEITRYSAWCDAHPEFAGFLAPWRSNLAPHPHLHGVTVRIAESTQDTLRRALRFCGQHALALDLLPDASAAALHHPLADLAAEFPDVLVVLAHLAGPPEHRGHLQPWMDNVHALAALPNINLKLSAMWSSPVANWPLADKQALVVFLLEMFTPRRLLFGSDWPFSLPAHSWKECLAAFTQSLGAQPMDVREQILGETAARVYQIAG